MTHGSLFSGIGGFDLAAQWMGWENVFHCELNPFGRKVLNHYWPNSESYEDITKTDFSIWRGKVDIITGGFPCQPFSQAGKRKGTEDTRHLWPRMLEVIRDVQPSFVVGENVYGLVNWDGGMVFDQVHTDLENEGYQVQAVILPASSVGAPHRRDRVWFVAYSDVFGNNKCAKTCNNERQQPKNKKQSGDGWASKAGGYAWSWHATNSDNDTRGCGKGGRDEEKKQLLCGASRFSQKQFTTYSCFERLQRGAKQGGAKESGQERDKQPARCVCPGWQNFPTQPPICGGDDGLPSRLDGITFPKWRNESIKAYGNAIVPQVAFEIFKAIEKTI